MEIPKFWKWRKRISFALGLAAFLYIGLRLFLADDYCISNVRYLNADRITSETYWIGIRGERISQISPRPIFAWKKIEGTGYILSPGFLDTNAGGPVTFTPARAKLFDGITTYLSAHGEPKEFEPEQFISVLNAARTIGLQSFNKSLADKTFDIASVFKEALKQSAYGISFSPEYNVYATPQLIASICRTFTNKEVPFSFHLRFSDKKNELRGLDEALECGALGNPIHILHLSSTGGAHFPLEAYRRIETARRRGQKVIVDFYPFTYWSSPVGQARFKGEWWKRFDVNISKVKLRSEPDRVLRFDEVQKLHRIYQYDPLNPKSSPSIIVDSISPKTIDFFAEQTDAFIGSDSSQIGHPRAISSFSKFLETYVKNEDQLANALHRFSTRAYDEFENFIPELKNRGKIEPQKVADLILWDPHNIRARASLKNPQVHSTGVVAAWIGGKLLIENSKWIGTWKQKTGTFFKGNLSSITTPN